MSFLCRQPNGLLCRFSTVEDSVTHYNMTDEEYIELRIKQAEEEAREFLSNKKNFYDFEEIKDSFVPNLDMSLEDFEKALVEMGDTEWKNLMKIRKKMKKMMMTTIGIMMIS